MPYEPPTRPYLMVRLPDPIRLRFKAAAEEQGRSDSNLLRLLINAEVERHEAAMAGKKKRVGR